ncbi:hypothetical protein [Alkalihalobacillus sp. CinArs1]|uniref:hypothetical protein n=1 Tax=Alkalihalobacillus sp. CinArs1 TaxID=2995314 RepID=UPI0022DD7CD0|nr:hypothetical protein [Alkalihalobacillus sp. CinArs1]
MELSFSLLINIVIAIYLYVDAKKRDKSAILWAILGLIIGPLVLGIYFIQTGRKLIGWIIVIFAIFWVILIIILGVLGAIAGVLF